MKQNVKPLLLYLQKISVGIVPLILILFNISCKSPRLSARIEFSKDTLMLDEEFGWNLIIKNESAAPISIFYDSRGNYHNELNRDSELEIVLRDTSNNIIEQIYSKPHDIFVGSGRVGFEELKKGQELKFPQWFTDWYKLDKVGTYTLEIEKPLMYGKSFLNNKTFKIKADTRQIFFYPKNSEKKIKIIHNLEQQYRSKSFKSWEEPYNILEMIIRSKEESSLDFYVELLNSNNTSLAGEAIRAIGKLSPSQKAFQVLVSYFDMGFENSLDESTYTENNKQALQQDLYFRTICVIEKFPPEMTIYFLNKVAANDKYGDSSKRRASQIMHSKK
jgi:hypothetical protein